MKVQQNQKVSGLTAQQEHEVPRARLGGLALRLRGQEHRFENLCSVSKTLSALSQ